MRKRLDFFRIPRYNKTPKSRNPQIIKSPKEENITKPSNHEILKCPKFNLTIKIELKIVK